MTMKRMLITSKHVARTVYCFQRQLWLLVFEVPVVLFFMQALARRRIAPDHPWATGMTNDHESVWERNIVYRSPTRLSEVTEATDAAIVTSIGRFLRSMVQRSGENPELPRGARRRMPHGVNYIHGSVHYNGVFLLFDDFPDLVSHLTDRRFRGDLLRFGRRERRELTLVFRTRKYDPLDYAYMVGCVRAHLPWFSNGNGPTKKPVLWGNMSPHPAINLINGAWMFDLFHFWRGKAEVSRPPVDSRQHFARDYFGRRTEFTYTDRLLAWFMCTDVRSRGFRGQLFFTNRSRIEPHRVGEYRDAGGYWKWVACHEVPWPARHDGERTPSSTPRTLSVVIPALNEAAAIRACLESVAASLRPDEIIVVDGGSTDGTTAIARQFGARVLENVAGGRGGQCAAGATVATSEVLVFLHADCVVGAEARSALDASIGRGDRLAMFRQRSNSTRRRYRLLDKATAFDSMLTRFGDQGIIVRRDFYTELGGVPDIPLMEDVHMLRKARRRGPIRRIDAEIVVSPRRFEARGVVPQLLHDARLLGLYYIGREPSRLYGSYYRGEGRCSAMR